MSPRSATSEGISCQQLTPLHLEIVMHYWTRGEDMVNLAAPAVQEYVKQLVEAGMVTPATDLPGLSYTTTEKGRVWIEHLLRTPFPVMKLEVPSV